MYTGEISISARNGYERDYSFDITVKKEGFQLHAYLWEEPQAFARFGKKLAAFPRSQDDTPEFQVGIITPSDGREYLLLKAFCYDANGHAALKVVMHNKKPEPHEQIIEFSIRTDVAALNKLGKMLQNWTPETEIEVNWRAQVS
jgi:hypothetical protein